MKVGDYVRFKDKRGNTYIRKVIDLPEDIRYGSIEIDVEANYSNMLSPKNIIKSSPNIIDLIEVGDYVNGYLITKKYMFGNLGLTHWVLETPTGSLVERQIVSIVTKEMFESMEYKIGE